MNTLVSFPLAKLLKKKGFDIPCREGWVNYLASFTGETRMPDNESNLVIDRLGNHHLIERPTIAEVVMWLYEKHGIWIVVTPHKGEDDLGKPFMEFDPEVWSFTNECIFHNTKLLYFNSPIEAYEAAIEYTLNNLI